MNNLKVTLNNYPVRGNQANRIKSIQAITAVEKCMKKYGIPKPPPGQRSRLHHDLPCTPEEKEAEVLRRFQYTTLHPKTVSEIPQKLNDLLVYAESGKSLKYDLIALAVIQTLETFEKEMKISKKSSTGIHKDQLSRLSFEEENLRNEMVTRQDKIKKRSLKLVEELKQYEDKGFLRRIALPTPKYTGIFLNSAQPIKRPKQHPKSSLWRNINLYAVDVDVKVRENINKFKEIGTVKKQLFSMPQYFRDRQQKGIKLPENILKTSSKNMQNIKAQGNETKMGRVVAKELAERKTMECLKQKLNPVRLKSLQ